jgi:uncharacterized repeat protein (TIGR01451 family)
VGKEAGYEVTLQNAGEVAADDVTVFVGLPAWAEVVNSTPSAGEVRPAPQGHAEPLEWVLGHVDAKAREKLVLRIVPRESRPFDLAVRWDYRPASSQATIEVQEPKLAMALDGPREVFFNKREIYKLKLSNNGNGAAENVVLTLMPVTRGETQPVTHRLGTLGPGEQRTMEMELTARQPGDLIIQVNAKGDGNAHAEVAERVLVHRAALRLAIVGPTVQYVGSAATYKIHVRNPGDATSKNIRLAVSLPMGVKFAAGSPGAEATPSGNKVQWAFDKIEAGGEQVVALKCTLALSGAARLEIASAADDELSATAEAITRVEAMADLRLEVKDPEGPIPVGEELGYELRLRNRGTKTAENVEVVAYFSSGIEPTTAEGHPHRVSPGQVAFSPIASLPPGGEVTLKVRARAIASGNHIFRAEVHCRPLGARLVQEETTHFYLDGSQPPSEGMVGPGDASPDGDSLRTARRPPAGPPAERSDLPPPPPSAPLPGPGSL